MRKVVGSGHWWCWGHSRAVELSLKSFLSSSCGGVTPAGLQVPPKLLHHCHPRNLHPQTLSTRSQHIIVLLFGTAWIQLPNSSPELRRKTFQQIPTSTSHCLTHQVLLDLRLSPCVPVASGWQEAAGRICLLFPADQEHFLVSSHVLAECHNLIVGNKSRKY